MLDELVKVVISEDVRSAITYHKVNALLASEDLLDLLDALLSCNIALNHGTTFYRCHLEQVDRDEVRLAEQVNTILL